MIESCYTCGGIVGAEHTKGCPRRASGRTVTREQVGEDGHVCSCAGGCCPVAYRDRCRFEQALRDPGSAQLAAATEALARGLGATDAFLSRAAEVLAGEVLEAAAAAVLDVEPCAACGRPKGTGTLLDYKPTPPHPAGPDLSASQNRELAENYGLARPWTGTIPLYTWRSFAASYRCPRCAEAVPDIRVEDVDWKGGKLTGGFSDEAPSA